MHDEMEPSLGQSYEDEHVHKVYQQIASHFSATRYKPWPIVEQFLANIPAGSIGLDIGCGNGKYLNINPNVFIIASDRSPALVEIAAKHHPHSSVVADILSLPHSAGRYDFAISIAVVHHLSTRERRIAAVKAIVETLKPMPETEMPKADKAIPSHEDRECASVGQALIYVWALEQKSSRRGWDEGSEQDVMVPWVTKRKPRKLQECTADQPEGQREERNVVSISRSPQSGKKCSESQTFHRYYHLYRSGELEEDIITAGGIIVESGYEKDNWWAIAGRLSGQT